MKIQVCSDLHLEFPGHRKWFKENNITPVGDILIIAGDTYYLNRSYHKLEFIKQVAQDFLEVYLIPGNHEYYEGYDIASALKPMKTPILDNVFMVNNVAIEIAGYNVIFSTMWSKILHNKVAIMRGMADFHRIKYEGQSFTIEQYNKIHQACFDFISKETKNNDKNIIVTHHLPSVLCNTPEFNNSLLNDAFCVDLTNFIKESNIDYWVYGHSHRNLGNFKIGKTRMLTNQFGYIGLNEHLHFDNEKVFEI